MSVPLKPVFISLIVAQAFLPVKFTKVLRKKTLYLSIWSCIAESVNLYNFTEKTVENVFTTSVVFPLNVSSERSMILALLTGMVIGVAVAIPPGPVMFVIVRGALSQGRQYAMKIAYGIAILDVIYSFMFSLATGKITHAVSAFSTQYPNLVLAFQAACILGLIAYGIVNLRTNLKKKSNNTNAENPQANIPPDETPALPAFMRTLAKHGPFFLGIALALTHLANPTFVPLMTSVSYVAGHYGFLQEGAMMQHVAFALGYASGVLAWLTTLVAISLRYRHLFSETLMVKVNRLLGMTMIGVGTYWGWHRFELMIWALRDMLKLGLAL